MAFPTSPTNGQTATVNGITYSYSSTTNSWARVPQSIRITYTASPTPPTNPFQGDQWYNNTTDVLYEYTNDTVSSYWLDIQTPAFVGNNLSVVNASNTYAFINVNSSLTLSANNPISTLNVTSSNGITLNANITSNTLNFDGGLLYSYSNSSYAQANTVFVQSNGAFSQANFAFNQANTAYSAANSALILTQNPQTTNYVLQLSDSGKHIYNTGSGGQTITIPNNGTVSWQTGTTIVLVYGANNAALNIIAATGVTMYLANSYIQKTYANLYAWGVGSLLNVGSNTWFINGSGVT